ncbi:MAG: fused MFS/spermidine synthase, partial [Phycisphaerales bacterium]|nr:fused MFS/spermidine synthase [Phycisphaerales bacterium]
LAVFFGGIALGSALFGRVAQRSTHPLRLYAVLELILAVVALGTPLLFAIGAPLDDRLARALGGSPVAVGAARTIIVAAILLPPTVIMGATLPLFCRRFVVRADRIARSVGFLYGANTLGAALGCAATGFVLLPMIGLRGSIMLAAALNVLVGIVAWRLRVPPAAAPAAPVADVTTGGARGRRIIVGLLFLGTGFVALGAEVVWTRFLALLVPNTVHTYTITLTIVLVGIVAGSWLTARWFDRTAARAAAFGALQVATGLLLLGTLLLPAAFWHRLGGGLGTYGLLLLPTAILSGAAFPLAVRMVLRDPAQAGLGVGVMTAVNTFGGILGALAIGFIGLPRFGLDVSVRTLSALSIVSGLIAWTALGAPGHRRLLFGAGVLAAGAWFAIPVLTGTRLPADFLGARDRLVDHREGWSSNLAVVRAGHVLQLEIDRWWQGEDRKNHQFMAAHVPMLVHAHPKRVLVVGIGTGQTPRRFLMHDIDALDCVDIEPALFEFVPAHFDGSWMDDPRVTLLRADGRHHIARTASTYDVISLEVGQLFRPGVATFYTEDFYRLASDRLEPGGVIAQFVPLPFLTVEEFRRLIASFITVFPQSMLWYNTSELLLLGVRDDDATVDPRRHADATSDPVLRDDLRYAYWGGPDEWLVHPAVFLAGFLCGPDGLATVAGDARPYGDDRPELEYATARPRSLDRNEIAIVDALRPVLEPVDRVLPTPLAPSMRDAVAALQATNVNDMVAHATLRLVETSDPPRDAAEAIRRLVEVTSLNPRNLAAQRLMADLLIRAGRMEEALIRLTMALDIRPDDPNTNRGMAFVLLAAGRDDEAIPFLDTTLRGNPNDGTAHNYLGAAYGRRGDHLDAIRHFEIAARLRPDDADIAANLARARRALAESPAP